VFAPGRGRKRRDVAVPREVLYDADGNETTDEALAVSGVLYEIDDDGNVVAELDRWEVDPKALDGDEGELPTRPSHMDLS
jgi:hypothetical protein